MCCLTSSLFFRKALKTSFVSMLPSLRDHYPVEDALPGGLAYPGYLYYVPQVRLGLLHDRVGAEDLGHLPLRYIVLRQEGIQLLLRQYLVLRHQRMLRNIELQTLTPSTSRFVPT